MEDCIELHAALKSKPLQAFVATKYGINPVPYRVNDELLQCYNQLLKKLQTELAQQKVLCCPEDIERILTKNALLIYKQFNPAVCNKFDATLNQIITNGTTDSSQRELAYDVILYNLIYKKFKSVHQQENKQDITYNEPQFNESFGLLQNSSTGLLLTQESGEQ